MKEELVTGERVFLDLAIHWLARHRLVLSILYSAILLFFIVLVALGGTLFVIPDLAIYPIRVWYADLPLVSDLFDNDPHTPTSYSGSSESRWSLCWSRPDIWGGGRVRIGGPPCSVRRRILSGFIFSGLMAFLTVGMFLLFGDFHGGGIDGEVSGLLQSVVTVIFNFNSDSREASDAVRILLIVILSSWITWLILAYFLIRNRNQVSGLTRLLQVLFVGS